MNFARTPPDRIVREFFAQKAAGYDAAPVHTADEHTQALGRIAAMARDLQCSSILDVGCGTGRAIQQLARELPGVRLCGMDFSFEMLEQGRKKKIARADLLQCDGYHLPLRDATFDAVCEFALLHHVRHPNQVVAEMCRVARKAVFLSDHNRYGQGSLPERLLKLALRGVGLMDFAFYIRTGGRGYGPYEGDGLSYSYSVFDSYPLLSEWADRIFEISIRGSARYPLLTAEHVLVVAIREGGARAE